MTALNKFKLKKDLKTQIEKETKGGKDDRFLPYYDLKPNQKIKVLIVPDSEGELWAKYSTHGSNLKIRGLTGIGCRYKNGGADCPICQKGFDLLNQSKETGDVSYKDEAKRWFAKDSTVMSVIVLESPIEYPLDADKNEVKLMHVPYAIEAMIKNALAEDQINEETLLTTPLWIKKTTNKGGQAAYDQSYFDRVPVSDDELAVFDDPDIVVKQYTYSELDIIPAMPTQEEAEEWLAKAEEADAKSKKATATGDDAPKAKSSGLASRLAEKKAAVKQTEPEEQEEEEVEEEVEQEEPAKEEAPVASKAQSLRERLAAAKQRS